MSDFIKTGVIGDPIKHSKSPLIHNHWLAQYALSGEYKAIHIPQGDLKSGINALIAEGYAGFNVTVPHKVEIMQYCAELSEIAQKIGAVNTICVRADGTLYGTNTDAYGFIQNIKESAPSGFTFEGKSALVLGAGGAANAVIYGLLEAGVERITLTNRSRDKAENLTHFARDKIKVVDWDDRSNACANQDIIVNTTALGMDGKPALEIDISAAKKDALICDIVYAPLLTDLLRAAKNSARPYVTGIGMLLHQARPGFELWNGTLPEVTKELEDLVLR